MRYVESRIRKSDADLMYRIFISEGLRIATKNTATFEGSEVMKMNYYEFLHRNDEPVDTKTKEEIVDSMKAKLDALGGKTNDGI